MEYVKCVECGEWSLFPYSPYSTHFTYFPTTSSAAARLGLMKLAWRYKRDVKLINLVEFFKLPADREVIARWTAPPGECGYRLELPQPPDPERFVFLALGDSGDSAAMGTQRSPQDAVAEYMAADAALPGSSGDGSFILHTGDVVYMTGERRLYDRNFRRPYAAFLTPESTVDNLVFRIPFLPVPGNHDYYDFAGWAGVMTRMPFVGAGMAAIARELFSFQIPQGGSDQGGAYMHAFVDQEAGARGIQYEPEKFTRIPNRYYRFRAGSVDFFGLDSNTLDAPPRADMEAERNDARRCVEELEKRAKTLAAEIERDERAVEHWLENERQQVAQSRERLATVREASGRVGAALDQLVSALRGLAPAHPACAEPQQRAEKLLDSWTGVLESLAKRRTGALEKALEALDNAGDDCCEMLEVLEGCFVDLPEGAERDALLAARDAVIETNRGWRHEVTGRPPAELCARLKRLSQSALDVQRDLARERRRLGRRPEDYDQGQIEWLRAALEESVRENPDGWRIVYLHQPLYTTIGDHSENSDVAGVRENLIPLLRDQVHMVIAGHAHAFEWYQSSVLPTTALVVTGGGGQQWLWRSILDPRMFNRYRSLYRSLRDAGATEGIIAGRGPTAPDGETGPLYHYIQVEVTPEALRVRPVGVRRIASGYRREAPMPVFHVPEMPPGDPPPQPRWEVRLLDALEIRRGESPRPLWG